MIFRRYFFICFRQRLSAFTRALFLLSAYLCLASRYRQYYWQCKPSTRASPLPRPYYLHAEQHLKESDDNIFCDIDYIIMGATTTVRTRATLFHPPLNWRDMTHKNAICIEFTCSLVWCFRKLHTVLLLPLAAEIYLPGRFMRLSEQCACFQSSVFCVWLRRHCTTPLQQGWQHT